VQWIEAVADPDNLLVETNEANNTTAAPVVLSADADSDGLPGITGSGNHGVAGITGSDLRTEIKNEWSMGSDLIRKNRAASLGVCDAGAGHGKVTANPIRGRDLPRDGALERGGRDGSALGTTF
jgi:hypothetical protein